mmetsp:Transcript_348/g.655  ORF Transcript_348/g.655 Transcript_348/m.655 type:complete len:389 (-) Transcript_348:1086-2252(-)
MRLARSSGCSTVRFACSMKLTTSRKLPSSLYHSAGCVSTCSLASSSSNASGATSSNPEPAIPSRISERILSRQSRTSLHRLPITCSMVSAFRLMLGRTSTTIIDSSIRVDCTSMPVSGAKRISRSCGYCESHCMSAPRSTIPCAISKTNPAPPSFAAYCSATSFSRVVDVNAASTPPITPNAFGAQNSGGSTRPEMPRYTLSATVSLLSLTMAELMTCNVVVYLLRLCSAVSRGRLPIASSQSDAPPRYSSATSGAQQRAIIWLTKKTTSLSRPRSTALYLTYSGPVYNRPPIASSSVNGSCWCAASAAFCVFSRSSSSDSERLVRPRAPAARSPERPCSLGHCGLIWPSASRASCRESSSFTSVGHARLASGSATKAHSVADVVVTP